MASVYSPEQVSRFLEYIQLPARYHPENEPVHDAAFLNALHIHTISTIPYENLSLHYSVTRKVSIDPQDVFQKIITDGRGRGGYCMENSIMFNHILKGLGFDAYMAGVRIRLRENGVPAGDYIGCTHIVNIVTLPSGEKWMLDVGFGGDGATKPLPLIPEQAVTNIAPQEIRLIRDHIPQQSSRSENTKLWIYQYRNGKDKEWNSFYAFPEFEFLEPDFSIMNWYTSTSPKSFQRFTMLIVKFLRQKSDDGEGDEEEIYGKRMLVSGIVKENLGGKTQIVYECKNEDDRIQALERWFGMRFTEEEEFAIVDHCTELR